MKKMMTALFAMMLVAATGKAMSYEQARNEALFLTDKMAYELDLTDEQYEAAYEINLDYLMGVTSYDDVYSTYWERRNLDMSYILLDWQWQAFRAATYFYRPLYWRDGYWHFGIYARYPHRDYFYFGRPVFYASYRGGHAWHVVGGHGYYYARRDHFRPAQPAGHTHFGMLDRWNRGDFRHNHPGNGGVRNSSTRTTVNGIHHNGRFGNGRTGGGTFGRPGTTEHRPSTHTHAGNSGQTAGGTIQQPATTRPAGTTSRATVFSRGTTGTGSNTGSSNFSSSRSNIGNSNSSNIGSSRSSLFSSGRSSGSSSVRSSGSTIRSSSAGSHGSSSSRTGGGSHFGRGR